VPVVLWCLAHSLGDRVGSGELGNDSWDDRFTSLVVGLPLSLGRDLLSAIFGAGPGLSAVAIKGSAGLDAVWSVLLSYLYDTGIVGFVIICAIGVHVMELWRSVKWEPVFGAFVAVWIVGITVTTSYGQLLPIWIALAFLTVWPEVVESPRKAVPSQMDQERL
jgi:hypothetical protein